MKIQLKKWAALLMTGACLTISTTFVSCSKDNGPDTPEVPQDPEVTYQGNVAYSNGILFNNGTELGNGTQNFHFTGNVTLERGTYLLKGWIYVDAGATLRIPAGTIIKGDKQTMAALIVEPGGYVEMKGTQDAPIVMTSAQPAGARRPGDWGGLIICGKARNNQNTQQIEGGPTTIHGGDNDADNSGIYQYIRIEFAGYPFDTDKEINGLTFGSVGSGTTVDHIQVSYSNDDSFEWFGGTVNCRYLVAFHGWDDDFDTDNGFSGNVQYGLSVRNAKIADKSQSNGFESDNNASGSDVSPYTNATFSNITFIGPKLQTGVSFVNSTDFITGGQMNPNNGSALGKFQSAMQVRRSSRLNIINSVAAGWPIGVIIDGEKGDTPAQAKAGTIRFHNNVFAGMDIIGSDANKVYEDVLYDAVNNTVIDASKKSYSNTFFYLEALKNKSYDDASALYLTDAYGVGSPFMPSAISPLLNLASFEGEASWFDKVAYVGAFNATDNWLTGWTCFDPQNEQY